jgi:preprotein translocase subunit SecA
LFEAVLANLRQHVTSVLSHVELRVQPQPAYAMAGGEPEEAIAEERATGTTGRPIPPPRQQRRAGPGNGADRGGPRPAGSRAPAPPATPCPCGSGKKFKHCHGRV